MTAALGLDQFLLLVTYASAVTAVSCPKCGSRPGQGCESTGGGNRAAVPTHKARQARIAHWSEDQLRDAVRLVRGQGRTWWAYLPADYYAATELAAAPIVQAAKAVTPRSVRLSEIQAERIEAVAEHRQGHDSASTAHFHGDHQERQTVQALESKGILRHVADSADGYGREYVMTAFGWAVYRQHRLIIRRMPDEQAAQFEAAAIAAEAATAEPERPVAPVVDLTAVRTGRSS